MSISTFFLLVLALILAVSVPAVILLYWMFKFPPSSATSNDFDDLNSVDRKE